MTGRGTTILLIAGLAGAAASSAMAQSPSPYDMTYRVGSDTPMRASMSDGGRVTATIPSGTKGIVMRWCRPEIPFRKWQFGGSAVKRGLLDARWCEVEAAGHVGNVKGTALKPE